jgi:hypothetical protein
MSAITCAEARASAAEFSFGLGDGAERADVVAHLDSCSNCRRHVEELTASADALLVGGPVVEPPAGFEERVTRAIAVRPIRAERRQALRWVLVAAAIALVVFGSGILVGRLAGHPAGSAVRSTAMQTPDGRTVGRVEVGRDPDTVFVALPGWRPRYDPANPERYRLRLTLTSGKSQLVGPVQLGTGDGSWGTVLPVDARAVRSVALVGEHGHAYCTGQLS